MDDHWKKLSRRRFLYTVPGTALAGGLLPACSDGASPPPILQEKVSCTVLPARPSAARTASDGEVQCVEEPQGWILRNSFATFIVSPESGIVTEVENRMTSERFSITGDRVGIGLDSIQGVRSWIAGEEEDHLFEARVQEDDGEVTLEFVEAWDDFEVILQYTLGREKFWIERRLILDRVENISRSYTIEELIYGAAQSEAMESDVLELGKFDRPRILTGDAGGLFQGLGWWFYSVSEEGVYENRDASFDTEGLFRGEPFYLGVFRQEDGEPYPGWLWYKTFLEMRKLERDKLDFSACWNAGYGQWGIDIDDPRAEEFIRFVADLGIRQIGFGGGFSHPPIPEYIEMAKTSERVRKNLDLCRELGLSVGFLEHGGLHDRWQDPEVIEAKMEVLQEFRSLGFGTFHFDYFATADTYSAHRNVTRYLRAATETLPYIDFHLGMAAYGPQFQREALLNHPTDLEGFELSHFSADWTTFLGFRHSRRQWQQKYQYLMPEYSLYYFSTHYANRDHPREYVDPEKQQLLWKYEGYWYNFHDPSGFRESLAAASAFSPFYVFGYLDIEMPEHDREFCTQFLDWVEGNADVISRARVCYEDERACVVSKVSGETGAIYLLNYHSGDRLFSLDLELEINGSYEIGQVFPQVVKKQLSRDGRTLEVIVPGESVVILELNDTFTTPPPAGNRGSLLLQTAADFREEVSIDFSVDPISLEEDLQPLPAKVLAVDQLDDPVDPIVERIGRGRLPERLMEMMHFEDSMTLRTEDLAPWAFADRIWLVGTPRNPVPFDSELPSLELNGAPLDWTPRVDTRPVDTEDWSVPLYFTDVTEAIRRNGSNRLTAGGSEPMTLYLTWVRDV